MRTLLIIVVSMFLLMLVGIFLMQRRLLYFPTHEDTQAKGDGAFKALRTEAGEFVGYVRDAQETTRVVVFFHGNGGEAIHRAWLGSMLPHGGVTVILAEYPGYGARPGDPTEASIQSAAVTVVNLALKRWPAKVTLVGESLGTGVATYVASQLSAERQIDRLALISPFTSIADVGSIHYPMLPISLLLTDRFDSLKQLQDVRIPLHIVHGEEDEIVPFALGKRLFEAYQGPAKTMTALPGVHHNDIALPLLQASETQAFRDFVAGL